MTQFAWPNGKRGALSLSFDDARLTQIDRGIPLLDAHGAKATFYVSLGAMDKRLDGWRHAVANGHEIGNHTVNHPCSCNFGFSKDLYLEAYSLERMEEELTQANDAIHERVGARPTTFAFPCGQKFVGRGEGVQSYVPLVARHFLAGRGFRDEAGNDPAMCDLAQLYGVDADCQTFEQLKPWIDTALRDGRWLIFASHEVGDMKRQTMLAETLEQICRFAADPGNGLWLDTVANIGVYVRDKRTNTN